MTTHQTAIVVICPRCQAMHWPTPSLTRCNWHPDAWHPCNEPFSAAWEVAVVDLATGVVVAQESEVQP